MFTKIKDFFKKWWGLILVPIGLFILSLFGKKSNNSYIEKEIKEEKKVIEETTKTIESIESKVEIVEDVVEEVLSDVNDTIEDNLEDKKIRDEKAKNFFPGL